MFRPVGFSTLLSLIFLGIAIATMETLPHVTASNKAVSWVHFR